VSKKSSILHVYNVFYIIHSDTLTCNSTMSIHTKEFHSVVPGLFKQHKYGYSLITTYDVMVDELDPSSIGGKWWDLSQLSAR
jgi:hypothetical protein